MKTKNFSQLFCLLLMLCFVTISCEKTAIEEEDNNILSLNQEDGDRGGGGGAQAN